MASDNSTTLVHSVENADSLPVPCPPEVETLCGLPISPALASMTAPLYAYSSEHVVTCPKCLTVMEVKKRQQQPPNKLRGIMEDVEASYLDWQIAFDSSTEKPPVRSPHEVRIMQAFEQLHSDFKQQLAQLEREKKEACRICGDVDPETPCGHAVMYVSAEEWATLSNLHPKWVDFRDHNRLQPPQGRSDQIFVPTVGERLQVQSLSGIGETILVTIREVDGTRGLLIRLLEENS